MINKEQIIKIFKRKDKRHGTSISEYISNAKHVWGIIIYVFVALNIVFIIFSGYLFLEINRGDIFKVEGDISIRVNTIDRALLRDTLDSFEKMENELRELKKKRPSIIDPSL